MKLRLITVKEFSKWIVSQIDTENLFAKKFPYCDFAIADGDFENMDLEEIKDNSSGWYGIKAIDTGFDSEELHLVVDYYGGGECAHFVSVFKEEKPEELKKCIERAIIGAFDFGGVSVGLNTVLIVEDISETDSAKQVAYEKVIGNIEEKLAKEDNCEVDVFEEIAQETFEQISSDSESNHHIGRDLWRAYTEDPEATDNVLIALCGWSMKSLLIFAGLIEDDEGLLP